MKEGKVHTRDGSLFYRSGGKGEPLILLHSLGVSSESWRYVIGPLSKKFAVHAVDLMGHGNSDKPDKNFEIHDYAGSVVELMDAIGIKQARVIGNSIGALVTLEIAASFPGRVVKQVLVGCPGWNAWERAENLMFYASRYDPDGNPKPLALEEISMTFAHPTEEILNWYNGLRAKAGIWCKKAQIAVAIYDIPSRLAPVKCPTLLLYGSIDLIREKEQALLKGIKGAKSGIIEDAGHLPQLDAPEAFLKSVSEFL